MDENPERSAEQSSGYTFSLVAQIGLALVAYTFTRAITLNSSPLGIGEGSNIELSAGAGLWV